MFLELSELYLNKNKNEQDYNIIIKNLRMYSKYCNEMQRKEIQAIINRYTNTINIGIDFGTSHCCCCCEVINGSNDIKIISDGLGDNKISSSVYYDPNSGNMRVGNMTNDLNTNVVNESKRFIGRRFDEFIQKDMKFLQYKIIKGENDDPLIELQYNRNTVYLSVVDITTEIFKHIKSLLDSSLHDVNNKITEAVIAVPINFNRNGMELISEACKEAGLKVHTISEPISVITGYIYHSQYSFEKRLYGIKMFLVYDFGGGSFNASIFKVDYDKKIITLISTGGDSHLGGIDIDNRLVAYYWKKYKDKTGKDLNVKQMSTLKRKCETAKIKLSSEIEVKIDFDLLDDNFIDLNLSRNDFNKMNEDIFDETMNIVDKVLNNANLKPNDIEYVLLNGSSSRIPIIREMLKMKFQHSNESWEIINPEQSVAYGSCAFNMLKEMEFRIRDKFIKLPYEVYQNQYIYPLNYITSIPEAKFDNSKNENENEENFTSMFRKSNKYKVYIYI